MATFTVTTAVDAVDADDGRLSLREAVQAANGTAAADRIVFVDPLEGATLTLTQGQLDLTADVTIDGNRDGDSSRVTVDADRSSRVFAVTGTGTDARLTGLGVTGGYVAAGLGVEGGGGILVRTGSALSLRNCTLSDNRAGFYRYSLAGGAVLAEAGSRLTVDQSEFTGNYAGHGGAIAAVDAAAVTLSRSMISDNGGARYGQGGGLWLEDVMGAEIARCTIAGNSAYGGGGVYTRGGSTLVRESTIAGNIGQADDFGARGAGILAAGELVLVSSTVTGNRSGYIGGSAYGAGIFLRYAGSLKIANSIVAGNFSQQIFEPSPRLADDIAGIYGGAVVVSNGHNLFGSEVAGAAPGDLESVAAARLFAALDPDTGGGRLALNGGPTPTVRLRDALDNPALSGADPLDAGAVDQRGVDRPLPPDTNPDIGSFELDQRQVSRAPSTNNDVLTGTAGDDALAGLAGNDLLRGLGGGDALRGQSGSDTLEGGPGGDALDGGTAWDLLRGGDGDDRMLGGPGGDALFGGAGADLLVGGRGVDRLVGGPGATASTSIPATVAWAPAGATWCSTLRAAKTGLTSPRSTAWRAGPTTRSPSLAGGHSRPPGSSASRRPAARPLSKGTPTPTPRRSSSCSSLAPSRSPRATSCSKPGGEAAGRRAARGAGALAAVIGGARSGTSGPR